MVFLGNQLCQTALYYWCRKNTNARLSLFGVLNFRAPYLPWILLGITILMGITETSASGITFSLKSLSWIWTCDEMIGIIVGHCLFYLEEIIPKLHGKRFLLPPWAYIHDNENNVVVEHMNALRDLANEAIIANREVDDVEEL